MTKHSHPMALSALSGLLTLTSGNARADVTMQNTMAVEGVGAMAFGNMSGTTKTIISGDKSRTESDIQMKSRLVRMLAHGALGPTAEIVRLDQDKIYHLNINKKEYTETSFEQLRAQMKQLSDQMNESSDEAKRQPSAIDESKCEWLPAKVDVKRTGEKQQVAGYDAERLTITASQPCKDKQTGSICELALGLDEWLASGFAESSEVQRYHKAYAQKMGLGEGSAQEVTKRAQAMFSRYKGIWTELASKMQGVKGYPVKSSFTLGLGGEQCQNSNARQAQAQSGGEGDSQSTNPAALAGAVAGKLGSLFHKKSDSDSSSAAAAPAPAVTAAPLPPGDVALMTIGSQLVSVSSTAASADAFEVPPDYKKQETKAQTQ